MLYWITNRLLPRLFSFTNASERRSFMRKLSILLLSLMAILTQIALSQPSHYTFSTVANLQDYGGYFEPATINNRGQVLFAPALLSGGEGILLWDRGRITTIAKGGEPTWDKGLCWPPTDPSDCPVFGYTWSPIQMNEHADVAFMMTRDGINNVPTPYGINSGVYRYDAHSGVVPIMVPGTPAPGGGVFWGTFWFISINNRGDIYFPAMACTTTTLSYPSQACPDNGSGVLALGVYKANAKGQIAAVVKPGDAAPGGGYFDFANDPATNEGGDVAFVGHIFTDPCYGNLSFPYGCEDSVFFKKASTGVIVPIAKVGTPSPLPGKNYGDTFSPMVTPEGDVVFFSDLSTANDGSGHAVFFYTHRKTIPIAWPGASMPGGGTFLNTYAGQDIAVNSRGEIVFSATLADGTQGIYLWRHGELSVVAKTGTRIGKSLIANFDDGGVGQACSQVWINDLGQILFMARFQEGGGALLVATPK
jgi:hypothetical protein